MRTVESRQVIKKYIIIVQKCNHAAKTVQFVKEMTDDPDSKGSPKPQSLNSQLTAW